MFETGKTAQVANEITETRVDILGVAECRWTDNGRLKLADGTTVLYPGRKDGQHQAGVAFMLYKVAEKALLDWRPINERLLLSRFDSKYSKLGIFQCYARLMMQKKRRKKTSTTSYRQSPRLFQDMTFLSLWAM